MGYEIQICGSIEIDRDKWKEFCNTNTEVRERWGQPTNVVVNMFSEKEWYWEGDELTINTSWREHDGFDKFLDEVVKLLNEDQTGYFDCCGQDNTQSEFYLKKSFWEELIWAVPSTPEWWLKIRNSIRDM